MKVLADNKQISKTLFGTMYSGQALKNVANQTEILQPGGMYMEWVKAKDIRVSNIHGFDYDGATELPNRINMSRNGGNYIEFFLSGTNAPWQFYQNGANSATNYFMYDDTYSTTKKTNIWFADTWGTTDTVKLNFGMKHSAKLTLEKELVRLLKRTVVNGATDDGTTALQVNGGIKLSGVLNMPVSTAPTSTADASGAVGDIKRDDNYIYVKTAAGWKRTALTTF